ncbi:hypothetical protein AAZX31_12G096100 [Glycine max]|nr:hypothetical protein GLYMA_12G100433v4 [Glycine max]KAH1142497.1 hypothetical protein GYH30_033266 [Glycine max]
MHRVWKDIWNSRHNMLYSADVADDATLHLSFHSNYMVRYRVRTRRWINKERVRADTAKRMHHIATPQHRQGNVVNEVRSGVGNVLQALNEMDRIVVPTQQAPPETHHFPQSSDNVDTGAGHKEGRGLH